MKKRSPTKRRSPLWGAVSTAVFATSGAHADLSQSGDPGHVGEIPYVRYQLCPDHIARPQGGENGYLYYSKRCTTAFVLPRQEAEFKLQGHAAPGAAVNETWCALIDETAADVRAQAASLRSIDGRIQRLEEQLVEADSAKHELIDKKLKMLRESRARIVVEMEAVKKRHDNIEGHSFQVSFATGIDTDVQKYRLANATTTLPEISDIILPEDQKKSVRFDAAPIANGVLAFVSKEDNEISMKKVLSARIAGLSASGNDEFDVNSSYINANGGLSGKLTLTLGGTCALLKDKGKLVMNKPITSESMSAYMVANFTYEVPVQVEYGYEASLTVTAQNLKAEAERLITNAPNGLSRSDVMSKFLNGTLKQDFKFRWKAPGPVGNQPKLSNTTGSLPFEVQAFVKESMMEKILDRMVFLGYIIKRTSKDINIPEVKAGHTTHSRMVRWCTKRKFAGFTYSKSCEDREEFYQIPAAGVSGGSDSVTDNSTQEFSEAVDMEDVANILHTSTFVPKK